MILFDAKMTDPEMSDCFHEEGNIQYLDAQQDWTSEIVDYGSRQHKLFKARRAIDTGDPDDFAFQLDKEMVIGYQLSGEGHAAYQPHNFET